MRNELCSWSDKKIKCNSCYILSHTSSSWNTYIRHSLKLSSL